MGTMRYSVSFRVRHPTMNPGEITKEFGLDPERCWMAGEPRTTPVGTPLGGVRQDTYWYVVLCEGNMPPSDLAADIQSALDKLHAHRAFLQRIRVEGGRSEFFVGWFLRSQAGETFVHSTLGKMADLGIDLALDTYHDPDLPDGE